MKKNILLVQSLLALPLITTSTIFSMDTAQQPITVIKKQGTSLPQDAVPTPAQKHANRKARKIKQSIAEQAKKSIDEQAKKIEITPAIQSDVAVTVAEVPTSVHTVTPLNQSTVKEETIELPMPTSRIIIVKETEETTILTSSGRAPIALPEKKSIIPSEETIKENFAQVLTLITQAAKKQDVATETVTAQTPALHSNILEASVYTPEPVTREGFTGWTEWAKAKISSKWFAMEALKNKTFDPENMDHMQGLMSAASNLVVTAQSQELKDLLDTCRTNYPNIELDQKVALQIRKRFTLDEEAIRNQCTQNITAEENKLMQKQEEIFAQNALLISTLTKKLEENNTKLATAHMEYMLVASDMINQHTKALKNTRDGKAVLAKLYRQQPNFVTEEFNDHSLNTMKQVAAIDEKISFDLETLDTIRTAIHSTIGLLEPKKTKVLQIDNK